MLPPSTITLIMSPCLYPFLAPQPAEFEFYDPQSPIYTSPRVLPPATIEECKVSDAIIAQGASIKQATISNAVIGLRSTINKGCVIQVRGMCGRCAVLACSFLLGFSSERRVIMQLACFQLPDPASTPHALMSIPHLC